MKVALLAVLSLVHFTHASTWNRLETKPRTTDVVAEVNNLLKSQVVSSNHKSLENLYGNSLQNTLHNSRRTVGRRTMNIQRKQQLYEGIPVEGAIVDVVETEGSSDVKIHGKFAEGIREDLGHIDMRKFNEKKVFRMLINLLRMQHKIDSRHARGSCHPIIYNDMQSGKAKLGHSCKVDLTPRVLSVHRIIVDKHVTTVLRHWNLLRTEQVGRGPGGNPKTGKYKYGGKQMESRDFMDVMVYKRGKRKVCTMIYRDESGIERVRTVNSASKRRMFKWWPHRFRCYRNNEKNVNGGYSSLNDAHFHAVVTYQMFKEWYNYEVPFLIWSHVHFGRRYENAFYYDDGKRSMLAFGDGDEAFYPFVTLDDLAHEIAHGVIAHTSALNYDGQSGGIDESFADMTGLVAYHYLHPDSVSWDIGAEAAKQGALRCFDDPPACGSGHSIDSICDFEEDIDVHFSSGIFNKAFYLMTQMPNVTIQIAYDIFLEANLEYWTPTTTFVEAAADALIAADGLKDELGYNYSTEDLADAFMGVNIECHQHDYWYCKPACD